MYYFLSIVKTGMKITALKYKSVVKLILTRNSTLGKFSNKTGFAYVYSSILIQ